MATSRPAALAGASGPLPLNGSCAAECGSRGRLPRLGGRPLGACLRQPALRAPQGASGARDAADDPETKPWGPPCSARLADHNVPRCAAVGEQRPDRSSSQRKGSAEGDSELEQRLGAPSRCRPTVPTGKRVGHWDPTKGQNASGSDVASPADQQTSAGSTRAADVARARL